MFLEKGFCSELEEGVDDPMYKYAGGAKKDTSKLQLLLSANFSSQSRQVVGRWLLSDALLSHLQSKYQPKVGIVAAASGEINSLTTK